MSFLPPTTCVQCGQEGATARYSLGCYYSRLCDTCDEKAGYRKDGPEGFDPLDAGETFEDADDPSALD